MISPPVGGTIATGSSLLSSSPPRMGGRASPPVEASSRRLPVTSSRICGDSASVPRIRLLRRLEDPFRSRVGTFSGSFPLATLLSLDPLLFYFLFPLLCFSQILEDSTIRSCVQGTKKRTELTSFKLMTSAILPSHLAIHHFQLIVQIRLSSPGI